MNYELWITIHSFVIAIVAGASLYSTMSQIKRENIIWKRLCILSMLAAKLERENKRLKKEVEKLKREGSEK